MIDGRAVAATHPRAEPAFGVANGLCIWWWCETVGQPGSAAKRSCRCNEPGFVRANCEDDADASIGPRGASAGEESGGQRAREVVIGVEQHEDGAAVADFVAEQGHGAFELAGLMVVVRGWRIGGRMVQGSLRVAAMRRTSIGTAWPSPRTASRHLGRRRRRDPASGAAGSRRRSRYPVERGEAEPREVILFRPEAARELAADSALVTPAVLPVSLGSVVLVTDAGPIQGAFRPCWRCFAGRSRSRRLASAGSWPKPSVTRRRISRGGGQI